MGFKLKIAGQIPYLFVYRDPNVLPPRAASKTSNENTILYLSHLKRRTMWKSRFNQSRRQSTLDRYLKGHKTIEAPCMEHPISPAPNSQPVNPRHGGKAASQPFMVIIKPHTMIRISDWKNWPRIVSVIMSYLHLSFFCVGMAKQ